mgnify:CR=1 FL=1
MKTPNLFPVAMKIAAKTIGQDLVSVQPMTGPGGMSKEERERIAYNGMAKVIANHTQIQRVDKLIKAYEAHRHN